MYAKPHLTYEQQVELLMSRGMGCPDRARALALLRAIGYYRLSAYVYPFREMLPEDEQCRASPVHYRSSDLRPGVTFEHAADLWKFDRKLRLRVIDGLELVEVGLRTQIAYVAGQRDTFAHVTRSSLDEEACSQRRSGPDGKRLAADAFEEWIERYERLQSDARSEDFVRHHLAKYGNPLPLWVAVEFLDFGALTRLYRLLDRKDQNTVAAELGVKGGRLLDGWLRSLNYVRNTAAHHNRLWNRTLTYRMRDFKPAQVGSDLHHLAGGQQGDKIYMPLAVTAYLVRRVDPDTRWPVNLRDDVRKFPKVPYLSPETDMGFPPEWDRQALWAPPA